MNVLYVNSPIGYLTLVENGSMLVAIHFGKVINRNYIPKVTTLLEKTVLQLEEYFEKKRTVFDIPICIAGTDFQRQVYEALLDIPYGKTASYKEIASAINNPLASRAVGNANNKNPLPIIVPCHRVIGSSGKLVGYAGGLSVKKKLLIHENSQMKF